MVAAAVIVEKKTKDGERKEKDEGPKQLCSMLIVKRNKT